MGVMLQAALVAPARDLGWVLAGVAGVIVALVPLTVLVWLARPRNPGRPQGSSRRARGGAAARISFSHSPFSNSQQGDVNEDGNGRSKA